MKTHIQFRPRRAAAAAFTLLEIMLVVMIIALLAGSAIYLMRGNVDIARETRVKGDVQNLMTQVQMFEVRNGGKLPSNDEGLKALTIPKRGTAILTEVPKDPWGNDYIFRAPAQKSKHAYDLYSAGKDMKPGTEDDIGNWE